VLPGAATGQSIVPIGPGIVPVQDGYGACFCNPGTKLIEQDEHRGTILISG